MNTDRTVTVQWNVARIGVLLYRALVILILAVIAHHVVNMDVITSASHSGSSYSHSYRNYNGGHSGYSSGNGYSNNNYRSSAGGYSPRRAHVQSGSYGYSN